MAFDVKAAQAAGYSDSDIAEFLSQEIGFDVEGARAAGYDDLQIIGELAPQARPDRSVGEFASDQLKSVASGVNNLASNMFYLAEKTPIGMVMRDTVEAYGGGNPFKAIREGYDSGSDNWMGQKSVSSKIDNQRLHDAEGFAGTIKTILENPAIIPDMLSQSLPNMAPGAAGARYAAAAPKAAAAINIAANAALEGADAGSSAEDIAYQHLINEGVSPEEAQSRSVAAGNKAGVTSALISAVASKLTGAGKMEADVFAGLDGAGSLVKAIAKEAAEEAIQEGGNQFGQNVGVGDVDKQLDLFEGVDKAAAIGSVLGAAQGGALKTVDAVSQNVSARNTPDVIDEINKAAQQESEADSVVDKVVELAAEKVAEAATENKPAENTDRLDADKLKYLVEQQARAAEAKPPEQPSQPPVQSSKPLELPAPATRPLLDPGAQYLVDLLDSAKTKEIEPESPQKAPQVLALPEPQQKPGVTPQTKMMAENMPAKEGAEYHDYNKAKAAADQHLKSINSGIFTIDQEARTEFAAGFWLASHGKLDDALAADIVASVGPSREAVKGIQMGREVAGTFDSSPITEQQLVNAEKSLLNLVEREKAGGSNSAQRDTSPQTLEEWQQQDRERAAENQAEAAAELSRKAEQTIRDQKHGEYGDLLLTAAGEPFKSEVGAKRSKAFRGNPGAKVVQVEGGYAVDASKPSEESSEDAADLSYHEQRDADIASIRSSMTDEQIDSEIQSINDAAQQKMDAEGLAIYEHEDYLSKADKERRSRLEAAKSAEPHVETPDPELDSGDGVGPAGTEAIEDYGEEIQGARKHLAKSLERELTDDDIASMPLSKIWPKKEVDEIEDIKVAAFAAAARSEIPAKPRVKYKLARWVEKVQAMRSFSADIVSGKFTYEQIMEKLPSQLQGFKNKIDLMTQVDRQHWSRLGSVNEYPDSYKLSPDGERIPTPSVYVEIDKRKASFDGKSLADVIDAVRDRLGSSEEASQRKLKFEVRGHGGSYFINKKGDREYRRLKEFTHPREAHKFISENYDELAAEWEAVKARDNVKKSDVRSKTNRPRTGADHRGGRDVSVKEFSESFGFRGIQFGNWVKQGKNTKERQGLLNQAYDAFMDLAAILNIPPEAVSLNGELGMAFGARGSGAAMAHYEPGQVVINLTKTQGAGSLAHEWFHALDNYFSKKRGEVASSSNDDHFITHKPERMYVRKEGGGQPVPLATLERRRQQNPNADYYHSDNWELDPNHPEGVRPEVEAKFARLVDALNESPMKARASYLDKGKVDGYWSRTLERAARSFENYIITRMKDDGFDNDFLANVQGIESFARNPQRYPYLLDEEVAPIAEAFDELFSTIKHRETDKGVELYAKGVADAGSTVGEIQAVLQKRFSKLLGSGKVSVVESVSELPGQHDDTLRIKGFYDGDHAYLVAANMTPEEAVGVLLHEIGEHAGMEKMLGAKYENLVSQFDKLHKSGDKWAVAAAEKVPSSTSAEDVNSERLAYLIQLVTEAGSKARGIKRAWNLARDVVAAVRAWFYGSAPSWVTDSMRLTPTDVAALARRAADFVGEQASEKGATLKKKYSQTGDDDDGSSDSYQRIYDDFENESSDREAGEEKQGDQAGRASDSDSEGSRYNETLGKLIAGEPVELIHRSTTPKTSFDDSRIGGNTGTGTAYLGHFLSVTDVGNPDRYGDHVDSFTVQLKKPLVISIDDFYELGELSNDEIRAMRSGLLQAGYDGIVIDGLGWVVALEGKVVETKGKYSVDDGESELAEALIDGDKGAIQTALRDFKSKHWDKFLAAIPRRYLVDFADEHMVAVDEYVRIAQRMDADRNQLMSEAADVVDRWTKFTAKNKAAAKSLARLMHAATIAGVDPDKPYTPIMTPEQAKKDIAVIREQMKGRSGEGTGKFLRKIQEVKGRLKQEENRKQAAGSIQGGWDSLPDEAKEIYREVRDSYSAQRNEIFKALTDRILRAPELSDDNKAKLMEQLRIQFESSKVEEPYFPLARFGEYWVAVREPGEDVDTETGEVKEVGTTMAAFSMFEKLSEQEAYIKKMKKAGYVVEHGVKTDAAQAAKAVDPGFAASVTKMVSGLGGPTANALADDIWQLYLHTLPDISARKHFIHRKKMAGFSGDAVRAYSKQMFHGGSQLGRLRYSDKLVAKLDELEGQANESERKDLALQLHSEMVKRHDWAMNPKSGWLANRATSLGFAWYLGATPAAAMVNLTQTPIVGFPVLAAKHSWGKAGAELTKAMKQATRPGGMEGHLSGEELAAYREFLRIGLFDKTQAHDLAGIAESGEDYSPKFHKAMEAVGWMFHRAEVWNREVVAMAAYRLGRKKGMNHGAAISHAEDMTWDAHFDYANTNRPRIMQNDWAKVFLLFKQYSLNMTYRLWRDLHDWARHQDPETAKEARQRFLGIMGMTFIFAGVSGMPLLWLLETIANTSLGDEDEPYDVLDETRAALAQAFGPKAAEVIMKGPVDASTGLTISSRVSLNNLWLRDPERGEEGDDIGMHYIAEGLGPVIKLFPQMLEAGSRVSDGHGVRGLEPALPKVVKDTLKGFRYLTEGATNMRGDALVEDVSIYQAAAQVAGFTPAELTMRYEQNNAIKKAERKLLDRRAALMNAYWLAFKQEDKSGKSDAVEAIKEFNRVNRNIAITSKSLKQSMRGRYRAGAQMDGGIMVSRRLNYLRDDLNFSE